MMPWDVDMRAIDRDTALALLVGRRLLGNRAETGSRSREGASVRAEREFLRGWGSPSPSVALGQALCARFRYRGNARARAERHVGAGSVDSDGVDRPSARWSGGS